MRISGRFLVRSFVWTSILFALCVTPAFAIVVTEATLVRRGRSMNGVKISPRRG